MWKESWMLITAKLGYNKQRYSEFMAITNFYSCAAKIVT